MEKEAARQHFDERLSLASAWQNGSVRARCLLVQNRRDRHHLDEHLMPFAARLGLPVPGTSADGNIGVMLYDFPNGHGAEPRSMLPEILKGMSKLHLPD